MICFTHCCKLSHYPPPKLTCSHLKNPGWFRILSRFLLGRLGLLSGVFAVSFRCVLYMKQSSTTKSPVVRIPEVKLPLHESPVKSKMCTNVMMPWPRCLAKGFWETPQKKSDRFFRHLENFGKNKGDGRPINWIPTSIIILFRSLQGPKMTLCWVLQPCTWIKRPKQKTRKSLTYTGITSADAQVVQSLADEKDSREKFGELSQEEIARIGHEHVMLLMEEIVQQVRLVVYPLIYRILYIPRWCNNSSINSWSWTCDS